MRARTSDGISDAPLGPNVQRSRVSSKKEPAPLVTGRPEELISHWLEGALQDWSPLYRDGEPARHLRLPTYPFAKQRCWAAAPAITPPRRERVRTTALEMALPHWAITEPKVDARWGAHRGLIVFGAERQAIRDAISAHAPHAQFLPPAHGRTVDELVELLRAAGPVDAVTWLLPEDATNAVDAESLVVEQSAGVRFGFRLVKALLALGYGTKSIRLNVVTWQTQSIRDEAVHPTHASVHGLIGSLAKEYPLWSVRLLDLPIERTEKTAALVAEGLRLETDAQGDALAWRSGRWYRPELLPVETPLHGEGITFRKDGVYVVVGGAGGLGEVLSEYLIREYQAKVVWIGRRPLDGTITSKLDRLGQLGVRPSYLQADAADASSLGRARRDILARHGAIHGVVHSAIVLRDKSLQNMDEPQFLASLSAKVDTSVRLAQAFGEDALDFVLFFSSMQTFFKAPGQSNYAAGCAFSDALAQRLKQTWKCAVKIMNWGYWGSVGIVADEAHHRRMAAIGMGSIEPDEGMDAVEHLLGAPVPQLAVVKRLHGAASSPKFFAPTATEATVLTVQSAPAMETLWGD